MNIGFLKRDTIYNTGYAYTMVETYGSNMDGFSEGGLVWSAQADMKLMVPKANLVGGLYRGNMTYG